MFSNDDITKMAVQIEKSLLESGDPLSGGDYAIMQVARAWLSEHPPTEEVIQFRITITYFKESGKFYTQEEFSHHQEGSPGTCMMWKVVEQVRKWQESGKPLPGLRGSWDYYILVDCEDGFPCLLLPKGS